MLVDKLIADVKARGGVSRAFQLILGASLITNVLLAGTIMTMDRTVRTIFIPPEVNKSFWVDGRTLSPEYLEQMGSWVISQFSTVSPASIDMQNANLLKLVHPSQYGELSIRFKLAANRLKADNLSKIFEPREVRISEKGQAMVMIGTVTAWVGGNRIPGDKVVAYLVSFDYDGSKTSIKELRETDPGNPFNPPNEKQIAEAESAATQALSLPPQADSQGHALQPAPETADLPPAPPGSVGSQGIPHFQPGMSPVNPNRR